MKSIRSLLLSLSYRQTAGYYAAFTILGLYLAALGPTLPALAQQTGSDIEHISWLFIARSFGYLLGSLSGGKAYDHFKGHVIMTLALLTMGTMMALVPVMPILLMMLIVMLLLGVAEGGLDVGGNTLLVWVHGNKVGPYMNGLHYFFGMGAFISPIILAHTTLMSGNYHLGYWILALLALPVAVWLIKTRSPFSPENPKNDEHVSVNILLVSIITLFFFLYVSAEASYGGWIYTYSVEMGVSASASAYLTSAFWGALTLGRLISIPIATRLRPRTILVAGIIGCLLSIVLVIIFPKSVLFIWIGTIGMGLSMASLFPTMLVLAERRMTLVGNVTRWFFVGAGFGGMLLPFVIGQYFNEIGPQITMLLIALDLILTLLVVIPILRFPHKERA